MGRMMFYCVALFSMLSGCKEQNPNSSENRSDLEKLRDNSDTIKQIAQKIGLTQSNGYVFDSGDTILVHLFPIDSSISSLRFEVELQGNNFEGVAHLELIEDNGQYILPESTPRLDEDTYQEYFCDSTFSYQSEKISFVFAMENNTRKRLSFIINNSTIAGIDDNFLTLYKKE